MRGHWEEIAFAVALIAVGILVFVQVPVGAGLHGGLGSDAVPRAAAMLLMVGGSVVAVRGLAIQRSEARSAETPSRAADGENTGPSEISTLGDEPDRRYGFPVARTGLFLITVTAYAWLLPRAGYLVASPPAFAAAFLIAGARSLVRIATQSLLFAVVIFVLFRLVGVHLPTGVLPW